VLFQVPPPTSITALLDEVDDKCTVDDFPSPDPVQLLVAPNPFAQGAVRLAYYAMELPTADGSGGGAAAAAATALDYVGAMGLGWGFLPPVSTSSPSPSVRVGGGVHSIAGKEL
jgi:hypothetical protein